MYENERIFIMTEEIKAEIQEKEKEEKCGCGCKCEALKAFLLVVFGSFLGCLVALCLFSAAMKPKMPPMPPKMLAPAPFHQVEHGKLGSQKGMRHEFKERDFEGRPDMKNFEGMPPNKGEFKRPERPPFED